MQRLPVSGPLTVWQVVVLVTCVLVPDPLFVSGRIGGRVSVPALRSPSLRGTVPGSTGPLSFCELSSSFTVGKGNLGLFPSASSIRLCFGKFSSSSIFISFHSLCSLSSVMMMEESASASALIAETADSL